MTQAVLVAREVGFRYRDAEGLQLVGVSFELRPGQRMAVMGATGAGKSTLALMCNGLIPHHLPGDFHGHLTVAGLPVHSSTIAQLVAVSGLVMQDPEAQLTQRTVRDEAAVGPANLGLPRDEVWARADEALAAVGLTGLAARSVDELSGGQQQRLAIAGMLAMRPSLLVLDEPTAELDPHAADAIHRVLAERAAAGQAVLWTDHDSDRVLAEADLLLVLVDGRVVHCGPPAAFLLDDERARAAGLRPPTGRSPAEFDFARPTDGLPAEFDFARPTDRASSNSPGKPGASRPAEIDCARPADGISAEFDFARPTDGLSAEFDFARPIDRASSNNPGKPGASRLGEPQTAPPQPLDTRPSAQQPADGHPTAPHPTAPHPTAPHPTAPHPTETRPTTTDPVAPHPVAVELRHVTHRYPSGLVALDDVSLTIAEGEFVALLGPNGAGKTTLAKHVVGLLRPTSGEVLVGGKPTASRPVHELAREVGFVFQNPDHQLFCPTVFEEVAFALRAAGIPDDVLRPRVEAALTRVGLEPFAGRHPFALGRSLRQRVAVASVLAAEPRVIVVDEPTTGQDWRGTQSIMALLADLHADGHTVCIITHDHALARRYASRAIVVDEGRVALDSNTATLPPPPVAGGRPPSTEPPR